MQLKKVKRRLSNSILFGRWISPMRTIVALAIPQTFIRFFVCALMHSFIPFIRSCIHVPLRHQKGCQNSHRIFHIGEAEKRHQFSRMHFPACRASRILSSECFHLVQSVFSTVSFVRGEEAHRETAREGVEHEETEQGEVTCEVCLGVSGMVILSTSLSKIGGSRCANFLRAAHPILCEVVSDL
eukprot:GHVT01049809.1.p1 GENE.GHVT01049809.1~~GHVT01049809.1.p1  ORF type:complete len:184 (-),score=2.02 GHVT01049809.1:27-578(-)